MAPTSQTSSLDSRICWVDPPAPDTEFLPNNGNLFPKYADALPKTAIEAWLFDALALDGSEAFSTTFFRDPVEAPKGFRVAVNASWADGTIFSHIFVLPISTVTQDASGHTVGVWKTAEGAENEASATFEISQDLSISTVTFNAPGFVTGTLTHKSKGYPSLPATAAHAQLTDEIFWMRPIAMASATLDITFTQKDLGAEQKRMQIFGEKGGYGGFERGWEGILWPKIASDSLFVRVQAGPYVLQVMKLTGRAENDYALNVTARLYCDGKLVCAPQREIAKADGSTAEEGTHAVVIDKLLDGEGLPATFRAKNVGYRIEFLAGAKWVFELRHVRRWWVMPTSAPGPGATGSSAFVVCVKGGLVGSGDVFEGSGMAGQVEMPENLPTVKY